MINFSKKAICIAFASVFFTSTLLSICAVSTILKGDIDDDNSITATDALGILNHVVGTEVIEDTSIADMDGNGVIDSADALELLVSVVTTDEVEVTTEGVVEEPVTPPSNDSSLGDDYYEAISKELKDRDINLDDFGFTLG